MKFIGKALETTNWSYLLSIVNIVVVSKICKYNYRVFLNNK